MSQWRSPLISCMNKAEAVLTPVEGWYALCFGYDNHNEESAVQAESHRSPSCYALTIQSPVCAEHRTTSLKLPLEHNGGVLEHHPSSRKSLPLQRDASGTALYDINIGKLVYFTEGCSLTVTATAEDTMRDNADDSLDNEADIGTIQPKWCVIHHRLEPQSTTTASLPAVGALSTCKKPLVCSICVRSFPTLRGVKAHIDDVHVKRKPPLKRLRSGSSGSNSNEELTTPALASNSLYEQPLQVIYQDAYMAIVVKPQGMPVMGGKPSLLRSDLLMALVCTATEKLQLKAAAAANNNDDGAAAGTVADAALGKPRPAHRLDSATGGILVVAKTRLAESKIRVAFQDRACHKRYRALVVGKLLSSTAATTSTAQQTANAAIEFDQQQQQQGVIDSPISGKESKTLFQIVRHVRSTKHGVGGWLTVVDLWPVTGRKHQLRRHMKLIGHHILGDLRHSGKSKSSRSVAAENDTSAAVFSEELLSPSANKNDTGSRLCLWAMEITLPHPMNGENVTFRMSDPEWLDYVIRQEEEEWKKTKQSVVPVVSDDIEETTEGR